MHRCGRMPPARHYSDLTIWKLADQLRVQVFALTARPKFARDLKAQGQADDAINSVCRNIAEGFACESHAEFARFLEFSRRSLNEVQDAMRGAQLKGYIGATDLEEIRKLSVRLYPALSRFIAYLRVIPTRPLAVAPAIAPTSARAIAATHASPIAPTNVRTIAPTTECPIAPTTVRRIAPTTERPIAPTSVRTIAPTSKVLSHRLAKPRSPPISQSATLRVDSASPRAARGASTRRARCQ